MKIINFAHGGFLTIGGYAALIVTELGLDPWLALPVAVSSGSSSARSSSSSSCARFTRPLDAILATWGLGIVIGQLITIAFGREVQFVQSPIHGTTEIMGGELFGVSSGPRHRRRAARGGHRGLVLQGHAARPLDSRRHHERDAWRAASASIATACAS